MTNREIDTHELTERINALLEEYGSIALSLPSSCGMGTSLSCGWALGSDTLAAEG